MGESLRTEQVSSSFDPRDLSVDPDAWDEQAYWELVATELTAEQIERVTTPNEIMPRQRDVLAVHWHPEFVPMEHVLARVDTMYPHCERRLIIPTQHNVMMTLGDYAGVEIDCYSGGFDLKVQLLAHFSAARIADAHVLEAMLEHTFRYRSSQLFDFLDTLVDPAYDSRLQQAAAHTGATEEIVVFSQRYAARLKALLLQHERETPTDMLKNKLIRNYFNALREKYPAAVIDRAQVFLAGVKKIVKQHFSLTYFYKTEEVIEEVRGLGGGIVIPHPEQFWPILLADYDVDGIEVWNPQSQQYTQFLIQCVAEQNKTQRRGRPRLLVFMGDDTHFGEKVLDPSVQDPVKAGRELGYQPAWDDLLIRKSLIVAEADRRQMIEEYAARLN